MKWNLYYSVENCQINTVGSKVLGQNLFSLIARNDREKYNRLKYYCVDYWVLFFK